MVANDSSEFDANVRDVYIPVIGASETPCN